MPVLSLEKSQKRREELDLFGSVVGVDYRFTPGCDRTGWEPVDPDEIEITDVSFDGTDISVFVEQFNLWDSIYEMLLEDLNVG